MTVATDGCLPVALDRLYVAVAAPIDPCREMADGVLRCAPSLYEQLVGEIGRRLDAVFADRPAHPLEPSDP